MLNNISTDLAVNYADVYLTDHTATPAKNLLFAVLERSISDLFIRETDRLNNKHKTDAMRWFLSPDSSPENSFSFSDVIQHLEISSKTTKKLMALAWSMQCKTGKYYDLYIRS